jgi:hypothetical protein
MSSALLTGLPMVTTGIEQTQMKQKLHELQLEHRSLDAAILRLSDDPSHDQLALTRMKRRKLLLKDQIAWIERRLDPDIRA